VFGKYTISAILLFYFYYSLDTRQEQNATVLIDHVMKL